MNRVKKIMKIAILSKLNKIEENPQEVKEA